MTGGVLAVAATLVVALSLLVIGLLALWRARRAWVRSGLPTGRVIYADTGDWRPVDHPIFSREHRLTGKPDYLVEARKAVIPVEVKSGAAPAVPYQAHVLQLAAYCLLVESYASQAPSHGLIRYADQTFAVDYTPKLRADLLATLAAMRRDLAADHVCRSHDDPARCQGCGYRADCQERLV
jgi:CRISPR-associated exonuclease Cas4